MIEKPQIANLMASNSHFHTVRPGRRPKSKSVTAQQTLEQVRNNQCRHRARRRDYVATLEQKLSQAEQSVTTLRNQVDALQAELAQCRNQDGQIMSGCPVLRSSYRGMVADRLHHYPAPQGQTLKHLACFRTLAIWEFWPCLAHFQFSSRSPMTGLLDSTRNLSMPFLHMWDLKILIVGPPNSEFRKRFFLQPNPLTIYSKLH